MSDDFRQYAAPIAAALIARLPADQKVTPQQAAELFEQVLAELKLTTKAPHARAAARPSAGG